MRFYERTLGGKLDRMMSYAEAPQPQQCPPGSGDRIMHASLALDGRLLMASDMPEGQASAAGNGFALALNYPTAEQAHEVFGLLADGGTVTMPMARTFWSQAFGMLTDRFGTPWMVGGGEAADA